ncbi:MAG: hypothetical protein Q4E65_07715 [Clostridia bacterium]|nr:hypothetical protein [Clostridia bacterium]
MPALNITLPDISGTDFSDAKQIKALKDYMYMLNEQLSYTLSHLDAENLSDSVTKSISASVKKSEEAIEGVEDCRSSIQQTKESISSKVAKGTIISEINQSAEQVKIKAGKIALEGVVTANSGFKINLDGSMEATAGSLGAFSADADGNLAGAASLQVGGVTLSGNHAAGLRITADNLDYTYGQPAGSSAAYMLGITDTGELCLFDLYIQDGQLQIATPGSVPQTDAADVILITTAGNGLKKRQSPSTASASLGACSTGERYGWTQVVLDAQDYEWYKCESQFTYDGSTSKYVETAVTPFYARQYSNGNAQKYFDVTTVNR